MKFRKTVVLVASVIILQSCAGPGTDIHITSADTAVLTGDESGRSAATEPETVPVTDSGIYAADTSGSDGTEYLTDREQSPEDTGPDSSGPGDTEENTDAQSTAEPPHGAEDSGKPAEKRPGYLPDDILGDTGYGSALLLGFENVGGSDVSYNSDRCSYVIEPDAGIYGDAACLISGSNTAEITVRIDRTDFTPYNGLLFYLDVSDVEPSANGATGAGIRFWPSDSAGGNDYIWTRNTVAPAVLGHEIRAYYLSDGGWKTCDESIMNGERLQFPDGFSGWVYVPFSSYITVFGPDGKPAEGFYRHDSIDRLMLLTGPYRSVDGETQNRYRIVFDELTLVSVSEDPAVSGRETVFVGYDRLGISGSVKYSSSGVAAVTVSENGQGFDVRALKKGSVTATVTDFWGHTAKMDITVEDGPVIGNVNITKKYSAAGVANVKAFGARGDGASDDTPAIQAAVDSLGKAGGTVYFPAGVYNITQLILRENVGLVLQGNVSDVKAGYTDALKKRVENGEFAVIRNTLAAANFMLNHDPSGSGRNGVGGISIKGGMIDMNGAVPSGSQIVDIESERPSGKASNTCALVFSNASGLLIDNVIFKDNFNGHAFQLTGCSDVLIKDCLFAGYTATTQNMSSRETVQIEYAHSGAIPPSSYDPGEYYFCSNIEITGCCFTNSDRSGYHVIPIGQHGMNREPNCTGLRITDNLFVNPYSYAIRLLSYADVEISGNTFVSDLPGTGSASGGTQSFIYIPLNASEVSYTGTIKSGGTGKIIYSYPYEHYGTENVSITGNSFRLCADSVFRVLCVKAAQMYVPGLNTVSGVVRQAEGSLAGTAYSGFVRVSNTIRNVDFSGNSVSYSGNPRNTDYFASCDGCYGFTFGGNTVSGFTAFSVSGLGQRGLSVSDVRNGDDEKIMTFRFTDAVHSLTVVTKSGEAVFRGDGGIRILTLGWSGVTGRPVISVSRDGNATVTADTADRLEGDLSGGGTLTGDATVSAVAG